MVALACGAPTPNQIMPLPTWLGSAAESSRSNPAAVWSATVMLTKAASAAAGRAQGARRTNVRVLPPATAGPCVLAERVSAARQPASGW